MTFEWYFCSFTTVRTLRCEYEIVSNVIWLRQVTHRPALGTLRDAWQATQSRAWLRESRYASSRRFLRTHARGNIRQARIESTFL
jgi:hypothetical protein